MNTSNIFAEFFVEHALWSLHFIVVFIFVAHLLRQRRAPPSTIAWFLTVLIAPYIGIPLYLAFGTRKFMATMYQAKLTPLSPDAPPDAIQKILLTAGAPAGAWNEGLRLLETGEEAYAEMVAIIDGAQSSIDVETYIFSSDEVGRAILAKLTEAARRGVHVRLLIDSIGALIPPGYPSFREFKKAGGKVGFFMPLIHRPFRGVTNLRNHRKQLVVDDRTAILGGMNIAREYMGPVPCPTRWTDLSVRIDGPTVPQLAAVFEHDWLQVAGKIATVTDPVPPLTGVAVPSPHLVQVVPSGPDTETDPLYEMLLTAIYGARTRVWIATPYFVPDEALAKALELAARKGVDVRLLLPRKSNHFLADFARVTYLEQLREATARFYFFPAMMHGKAVLVDSSCAITGSANFDARSLLLNYELSVCLYTIEDIGRIEKWFTTRFGQSSETFPAVRPGQRLAGDLARVLAPLI